MILVTQALLSPQLLQPVETAHRPRQPLRLLVRLWSHQSDAARRLPLKAAVHLDLLGHVPAAGALQLEARAVRHFHHAHDSAGH